MIDQFSRTELVLGRKGLDKLASSRVIVFGVGGVGGYAAEALARCGIGSLDLVDNDEIGITNLNRQIAATHSTLGLPKAVVMADRVRDINPDCNVSTHQVFYLPGSADAIDLSRYDYIVDAVDTVTAKLFLIERATKAGIPIISSMGTANKLDPSAFEVADIYETSICPLAKIIRKECRKRGIDKLKVVYSREPVRRAPDEAIAQQRAELEAAGSNELPHKSRRDIPGSVSFVPPVAGFMLAGEVVKDLVGIRPVD